MAGMPASIVRRAEEVLRQLEDVKTVVFPASGNGVGNGQHSGDVARLVAEANGTYSAEKRGASMLLTYAWQSEEARSIALALEQGQVAAIDLDAIDVCAITPLDALNLLFLLQKQRKKS